MKVVDLKTGKETLEGRDCWKHAFPMHGCTHRPADVEALAAVEAELRKLDKKQHERVTNAMKAAGSYPCVIESEKPVAKLEAVPERPALRTNEPAKSGKA